MPASRGDLVQVAVLDGDRVHPVADLAQFWSDPTSWAAKAQDLPGSGLLRADVELVSPVPPAARDRGLRIS